MIKNFENFQSAFNDYINKRNLTGDDVSQVDKDFDVLKSIFSLIKEMEQDKLEESNDIQVFNISILESKKVRITIVPFLGPKYPNGANEKPMISFLSKDIFHNIYSCINTAESSTEYELDSITISIHEKGTGYYGSVVRKNYDNSNIRDILLLDNEDVKNIRIIMSKI